MSYRDYRIVYPRGDRSKLAVAHVLDYEVSEYDIASSRAFDSQEVELARKHGLNCPNEPKLLD